MATYRTTLTTTTPAEVVFDYLARFSSAVEWDPGVVASRDLTPGAVRLGSDFELTVRLPGREVPFRYVVTAIDRPGSVRVRAETGSFVSSDTIEVTRSGESTVVTYSAVLEPKGLARLLAPVLPAAFRRIGDRASEGLQREIDRLDVSDGSGSAQVPRGQDGDRT